MKSFSLASYAETSEVMQTSSKGGHRGLCMGELTWQLFSTVATIISSTFHSLLVAHQLSRSFEIPPHNLSDKKEVISELTLIG